MIDRSYSYFWQLGYTTESSLLNLHQSEISFHARFTLAAKAKLLFPCPHLGRLPYPVWPRACRLKGVANDQSYAESTASLSQQPQHRDALCLYHAHRFPFMSLAPSNDRPMCLYVFSFIDCARVPKTRSWLYIEPMTSLIVPQIWELHDCPQLLISIQAWLLLLFCKRPPWLCFHSLNLSYQLLPRFLRGSPLQSQPMSANMVSPKAEWLEHVTL